MALDLLLLALEKAAQDTFLLFAFLFLLSFLCGLWFLERVKTTSCVLLEPGVSAQTNCLYAKKGSKRTSFPSVDFTVDPLESSRKRLGVRLIFRVSMLSSLKNESVFRTVPFLDRPAAFASSKYFSKDKSMD